MPVRRIIIYGHALLKQRAAPVKEVDAAVQDLIGDLFDTMYAARGIGLAANQVSELVRVIVVDPRPSGPEGSQALALVNPEIREYAGSETFEEGCLSVPGVYAQLRRPNRILVRYLEASGEEQTREFTGMMARVIQHEIDHLEGRLFVERLSSLRRTLLMKKLREIEGEPTSRSPLL